MTIDKGSARSRTDAAGERGFLGGWVRATFYGWAVGFVFVLVLLAITGAIGLGETQFAIGLGMGAGVGWLQGRFFAPASSAQRAWLIASAIGVAAPFIANDALGVLSLDRTYSLAVLVVMGGFVTGVLQWLLLRRSRRPAAWWIPASVLGWCAAASTVFFNDRYLPRIPGVIGALLYIAIILLGGILLGAITGIAMRRILSPGAKPELHERVLQT